LPNHFFGDAAVRSDIGKGNKQRVIELEPFDGYSLMASLPVYAGMPLLFWHYDGEGYKSFATNFGRTVRQTAAWAKGKGIDFRPIRFHDLRHWHAVQWPQGRPLVL
jgi:integrase/recombinase XerD